MKEKHNRLNSALFFLLYFSFIPKLKASQISIFNSQACIALKHFRYHGSFVVVSWVQGNCLRKQTMHISFQHFVYVHMRAQLMGSRLTSVKQRSYEKMAVSLHALFNKEYWCKKCLLIHQKHFWIRTPNEVKNNAHTFWTGCFQDRVPHQISDVSLRDPGTWCSRPCPQCRAPPGWWCCRSQTWSAGAQ